MKKLTLFLAFSVSISFFTYSQCSDPYIGEDFDACGVQCSLSVTNATTGTWTVFQDGTPYSLDIFPNTNSPNIDITIGNFDSHYIDIQFVWTDDSGPCSTDIMVRFAEIPDANVGPSNIAEICGTEFTFEADTMGHGWATTNWTSSIIEGDFNNSNAPNATFNFEQTVYGDSAYVSALMVWETSNFSCVSTDTMWITFYQQPEADTGEDISVCGTVAELEGEFSLLETDSYTPDGYWSIFSTPNPGAVGNISSLYNPSSSITVSHYGIWELVFRENNDWLPSCYDKDTITVEFVETPITYAGDDREVCGTCVQLGGFDGHWISPTNPPNNTACVSSYGQHTFVWEEYNQATTSTLMCTSQDEIIVTFYRTPTANITIEESDTLACGLTYENLSAEAPENGINGYWYDASPATVYENQFDNNTWASVPSYGQHEFYWIEENGPDLNPGFCNDSAGPFKIHFLESPVANLGPNDFIYGTNYPLSAVIETEDNDYFPFEFIWKNESLSFEDATNINTAVDAPTYGEYEITTNLIYQDFEECSDKDTITINFLDLETISSNAIIINVSSEENIVNLSGNNTMVSIFQETINAQQNQVFEVVEESLNGYSNQIVFSDLPDGTYFIQSKLISPNDFPEIYPSVCFYQSFDILHASSINISGESSFTANIEHPTVIPIEGSNTASGIVGTLNSGQIIERENALVILYNTYSDEIIDIDLTNENGIYEFDHVPDNTNIAIYVSNFEYSDFTAFTVLTEENQDYIVHFIINGNSVAPASNAVEENQYNKHSVYPNPTNSLLNINSELQITDISISDINGRIVLSQNNNHNTIDVSSLEAGVYFIKVITREGDFNQKFIKQ